jgi:Flp pilus assembly protein TadG
VPVVCLFFFFMTEMTIAFGYWMQVEHASRAGARCGATRQLTTAVQDCAVRDWNIQSTSTNPALARTNVTVCGARDESGSTSCSAGCTSGCSNVGDPVKVQVTYAYTVALPLQHFYHWLTGGSLPTTITMTAQTVMRLEDQTA